MVADVMPTSKEILGFANRWYEEAVAHCIPIELEDSYDSESLLSFINQIVTSSNYKLITLSTKSLL